MTSPTLCMPSQIAIHPEPGYFVKEETSSLSNPSVTLIKKIQTHTQFVTYRPVSVPKHQSIYLSLLFLWFVHDGRQELFHVSTALVLPFLVRGRGETHLLLVPCGGTGSENVVLDTTGRQMVQHRVVGHDQHAAVVFHWRGAVQDALAQEHGQSGWCGQIACCGVCTVEP